MRLQIYANVKKKTCYFIYNTALTDRMKDRYGKIWREREIEKDRETEN